MPPKKIRSFWDGSSIAGSIQSPPKTIESISDKELLFIFSRLSFWDLQTVELVNRRWQWIALKVCSDRTDLSLIQTPVYRDQLTDMTRYWFFSDFTSQLVPFEQECYRVKHQVTQEKVQWFGTRFPKVTQLTLYCVEHLELEKFVQMIRMYPNLSRLVLFCSPDQQSAYCQTTFWSTLHSLRFLNHLYVPFHYDLMRDLCHLTPLILSPAIRSIYFKYGETLNQELNPRQNDWRIECFSLMRNYHDLGEVLMLFAQNPNNPRHNRTMNRYGLYMPSHLPPNILNRLAIDMTRGIINVWPEITHLDLILPDSVNIVTVLPNLVLLHHLTNLRLTDTGKASSHLFYPMINSMNYRAKLGPHLTLPQIRHLYLSRFHISSNSGIFLYFSVICPQIRALHLEDCTMAEEPAGIRLCSPEWLHRSFNRFPQLTNVSHNNRLVVVMARDQDRDKEEMYKVKRAIEREMFKNRL